MHGGGGDGGGVPSVRELLPELCKITGAQQLHHVHRLDATTTGDCGGGDWRCGL